MAVALEQFVKQLADSGVIAPGKLENFVPPRAQPKDAQELARQLVQGKHLTKYQVQEIYQGRAKSLILGNYTILDKIGAGGMGQVFKAEHRRMHRTVAIKMLPKNAVKSDMAVARFQREVEAAAKLRHSNIVATDDADEANGNHFLVMEYIEGSDLSALVKKDGPLSVRKAVNYILQAARGLEFAHAEHVVHRDIKPANLLLDKKGTVKILDMGLARIESDVDAATQAELTGTGAVMGTVDYMAPEQGLSTKHADARADIYSLGCTLHYMLIGKPAYGGETITAKLLAHHHQPIPNLCELNRDVPEELQRVFDKMVAKKIEDRYQTMSEVVVALAALEASASGAQTSLSVSPSVDTNPDADVLTFLRDMPKAAIHEPKPKKKPPAPKLASGGAARDKRKLILGAVAAALLGILVLAVVIFKMRTSDGTLVVEVNQPNALVQVLDSEGKVEISKPGEKGSIDISVDPGKHRLKVEKDGFQFFAQDFEMESGGTATIKATLVEDKPWFKPDFLKWQKEVAALPAEQQVVAVVKKLQELNPGFDGNQSHAIEKGVVTRLEFHSGQVTDISPVRALAGLKRLECWGTPVSDLSPLAGMSLTLLNCDITRIRDLSPLNGVPLTTLHYGHTDVADLSPLKGMPLTELASRDTKVSDLSPLKGMRLTILEIDKTRVSDLSPLHGMPLTVLYCNATNVSDLSPLEGMRLNVLWLTPKNITKGMEVVRQMKTIEKFGLGWNGPFFPPNEFWNKYDAGEFGKPDSAAANPDHKPISINGPAFQQWMKTVAMLPAEKQVEAVAKKLQELNPGFDGKVTPRIEGGVVTEVRFVTDNVTDISPLRALAGLKGLTCFGSDRGKGILSDLSPLMGMSLAGLDCQRTKVTDLSPLEGMPLTDLRCRETPLSDLSPLKGMPLKLLGCEATKVADLSPLGEMPLARLSIEDTPVSDLSPLNGVSLTSISLTPSNITRGMEAIRQMKSLQTIGPHWNQQFPFAEFWKKYDAGEFNR